jgi:cytoskeletal protein RodZ
MPSFGDSLRREREMRGVSLEEISDSTKINVRFLKALEEDRFDQIPGGVFIRSFIRAYAGYLGLEVEPIISEYQQAAQATGEIDVSRLAANRPLAERSRPGAQVLVSVFAVALLVAGYLLFRYSQQRGGLETTKEMAPAIAAPPSSAAPNASTGSAASSGSNSSAAPAPLVSADGPAAAGGATTAENAPPGAASAGGAAQDEAANTIPALGEGDLVLQVKTTDKVWLSVEADGKTLLQQSVAPNTVRLFRAHDSFDVRTGNAYGTSLTLNRQALGPLGRPGEFRQLHLTKDGIQSQSAQQEKPSPKD